MTKTKYVFILDEDSYPPMGLESCYIFDNPEDAESFYKENGFIFESYGTGFAIKASSGIRWVGDVHKGLYV
jgi:hypothetical protein